MGTNGRRMLTDLGLHPVEVLTIEVVDSTLDYWSLLDTCLAIEPYISSYHYSLLSCDIYFIVSKHFLPASTI